MANGDVLLEVTDLVKHFPIRSGVIVDREVARVRAVDGVSRPAPGGRTVGREDSAVVTCCAHLGRGGIICGVRRGCPRKDLGALSL